MLSSNFATCLFETKAGSFFQSRYLLEPSSSGFKPWTYGSVVDRSAMALLPLSKDPGLMTNKELVSFISSEHFAVWYKFYKTFTSLH
jgi:hypothetical protein